MQDNIKYQVSLPRTYTAKELSLMPYTKMKKCSDEHDLNFYKKRIEQLQSLMGVLERHWKKNLSESQHNR